MLHCIVGYIGDTRLPGLVNPFLFCKERVIPSCAANSCFACFVKTEQRKSLCVCNAILRAQCCHSFDVYLNSSMSRRSIEGLTDNHWKKIFVGEKTNKKGALEFCTRGEGERRGSFEPVACQSFFVFLCEEMSESSLFLLHATSPQSLGKPAAQVGEKLSLWTLKEERQKKKICLAFELSQQQHTHQPYLSRVCMGIRI